MGEAGAFQSKDLVQLLAEGSEVNPNVFSAAAIFLLKKALMISIEINTTIPNPARIFRQEKVGLVIPKASRICGIWITTNVNTTWERMARMSQRWGGVLKILYLMDRKFRAMINSMMMKRKKISVLAVSMSARSA